MRMKVADSVDPSLFRGEKVAAGLIFLPLVLLLWLPCAAFAVSRIELHIDELQHPAARVKDISATLSMDGRWQGRAALAQADLAAVAKEFSLPVNVTRGAVLGQAEFSGQDGELRQLALEARVREVAFSDAEGLHAGEKLGGHIRVAAHREGPRWQWQGKLDWITGEAFWQPLYFANGGHALQARGWLSADTLAVESGALSMATIGQVDFSGRVNLADRALGALQVRARNLDVAAAYALLLKPYLQKGSFGDLEMAGRVDFRAELAGTRVKNFVVSLRDFDVEDKQHRFAFYKLNANIPWDYDAKTEAWLAYAGGSLFQLDLGAAHHRVTLERYSLTAPHLELPVLDGALVMNDVAAALVNDQWHWRVGAELKPVSMSKFSQAMGWPHMEGKIALRIPMMYYTSGQFNADGDVRFEVFDGVVALKKLVLQDPLGPAPRLFAELEMRRLDLRLLTQTFTFGDIEGRLDGDVRGLELSRWQPVKFDASFRSSPGEYPKKFSLRAVENISALGGAGAVVAIKRSVLRFFEQFNYAAMGLSCKLNNGVCILDGIAPSQSGYFIVKPSGIPAITLMGYNRSVNWNELLERVQAITQGNSRPVIK